MADIHNDVQPARSLRPSEPDMRPEHFSSKAAEDLHQRYVFASLWCKGLDVLDWTPNAGDGPSVIAQVARSVTAFDSEAGDGRTRHLKAEPADERTTRSDLLLEAAVDVVIALNPLSRSGYQNLLGEIGRVLRPGGLIVANVSSDEMPPQGGTSARSEQEADLNQKEFIGGLCSLLANVTSYAQRDINGSLIGARDPDVLAKALGFDVLRGEWRRSPDNAHVKAVLVVASNARLPEPVDATFFSSRVDAAVANVRAPTPALSESVALREARDEGSRHLNNVNLLRTHLLRLDGEIERNRASEKKREQQLLALTRHVAEVEASFWWKAGGLVEKVLGLSVLPRMAEPSDEDGIERADTVGEAPHAIEHIDPKSVHLPVTDQNPLVSVVILSYGAVDYTLRCLAAIGRHHPRTSIEVIVSDDCSGDPKLHELGTVRNLKLIRPPENLGFLRHANWAVAQSAGAYVLLLNNDTEPQLGAIDALVELAIVTPNVGLVGSKLVYPDGRLQEAGGIVWNDASAWNYGRLQDPKRPDFEYVRDADYISGASILVPRRVWDELGGFDERFAPAYYEDTDFAFRVRASGRRVQYQPASVVIHHEGISHGTDLTQGFKAYQVLNRDFMIERWGETIAFEQYPNGMHVSKARDRAMNRRTVLIIDHYVPEPDRDAGSRNILNYIQNLQIEGCVVKFWPQNLRFDPVYTAQLQQAGVEVFYSPWFDSFDLWFSENAADIDLILLSRPTVAPNFLPSIKRWSSAPVVYYGHDLHFARMRLQASVHDNEGLQEEADAMERLERRIWREVDVVVYPSDEEVEQVSRLEPACLARRVTPFCFDSFESPRPAPKAQAILFVAGFGHPPNIDAALWLTNEIFPAVRRSVPGAHLWIVGSNPVAEVLALASEWIEVTGHVSTAELASRYKSARVAIVPLRFGAGVKLKVVEALHDGLPLVTTPVGAQGLERVAAAVPVRERAEDLAADLIRLLTDDSAWNAQSARQLEYARQQFSRRAAVMAIAEVLEPATARVLSSCKRGIGGLRCHPVRGGQLGPR
jgi:GT2 family glycosyltransferase/SAM-dependent methyltransferase